MGSGYPGGFYPGEYPTVVHNVPTPIPGPIIPTFQGMITPPRAADRGVTPSYRRHGL